MNKSARVRFSLIPILLIAVQGLFSCGNDPAEKHVDQEPVETKFELSQQQAKTIFDMPVHCVNVEYPNKLGQSIGSDADLKPPRVLRPIFTDVLIGILLCTAIGRS